MSQTCIVFIHGFLGHPNEFGVLLERLNQQGATTRTICLPQHGDSPGNLGNTHWEAMVAHCEAELKQCFEQFQDVHLVGFSLGGALAVLLAAQWQRQLSSLTLLASPCKSTYNAELIKYYGTHFFKRFLPGVKYIKDANTGHPKPYLWPHQFPQFYQHMNAFFMEVRQSAKRIELPTLLFHSVYDLTVPYDHSLWLYEAMPGASNFISLLQCGHQIVPRYTDGLIESALLSHVRLYTKAFAQ